MQSTLSSSGVSLSGMHNSAGPSPDTAKNLCFFLFSSAVFTLHKSSLGMHESLYAQNMLFQFYTVLILPYMFWNSSLGIFKGFRLPSLVVYIL